MRIRDSYEGKMDSLVIKGESMDIIADDGKTLFGIELKPDGSLQIHGGSGYCKFNGKVFEGTLIIEPVVSNVIVVRHPQWRKTR